MMTMNTDALKELGMSDVEIRIYLALLREGEMTATMISEKTGVYRPSVYDNLKQLIDSGLVSHITVTGKTYFRASTPKKLLAILNEKKEKIAQLIPELEQLVPAEREDFYADILEGKEGLKSYMEEVLNGVEKGKIKKFWGIGGTGKLLGLLQHYMPNVINRAIENEFLKKTDYKYLSDYDIDRKYEMLKYGKNRLLPKKYGSMPNIEIVGDTLNIVSLDQPIFVVRIRNATLAKKFENLFMLLWRMSSNR